MKLVYNDNFCELYNGNMLDMISSGHIKPMSVDCIVTDPPYELNFMGKSWDNQGVSFQKETWKVCYDVLKPGGYLLAFGGSRTYHRIACAIEDAGFEIRDTIMWIYGSGFPKSMNLGVAIDKKNGVESKVVGISHKGSGASPLKMDNHDNGDTGIGMFDGSGKTFEVKKANNEWDGWGTCLKPAFEPVIVARKPFDGSLVDNVLKYGVGGLNIDECRIPFESTQNPATNPKYRFESGYKTTANNNVGNGVVKFGTSKNEVNLDGRFPANLILTYDETDFDEVCGGFPVTKKNGSITNPNLKNSLGNGGIYSKYSEKQPLWEAYNDSGSASRYFYCAKASKKDREEGCQLLDDKYISFSNQGKAELKRGNLEFSGDSSSPLNAFNKVQKRRNIHPSVKPTELMQYLVRLVAPKGATILDPFMGSGSTGKAVMFENRERNADYKFIGVELSEEYLPIAEARIKFAECFELDTKEIEKPQKHPRKSVEKSQKSDEKMFEKWGFDV
jgi:site-specific DNA-methyltransferase (adenine-specific)